MTSNYTTQVAFHRKKSSFLSPSSTDRAPPTSDKSVVTVRPRAAWEEVQVIARDEREEVPTESNAREEDDH